jgi:DNA-binding response OmpR family regulator
MPCIDGAELCQWGHSQHGLGCIYFIIMTPHRKFNLLDGLDAGADEYLQKPIRVHELMARLRGGKRILQL